MIAYKLKLITNYVMNDCYIFNLASIMEWRKYIFAISSREVTHFIQFANFLNIRNKII